MASEKQLANLRKARAVRAQKRAAKGLPTKGHHGGQAVVVTRIVSIGGGGDALKAHHDRKRWSQSRANYPHLSDKQYRALSKAWAARRGSGKGKGKAKNILASGKHSRRGRPAFSGPALPPGWVRVKGVSRPAMKRGRKKKAA